MLKGNAIVGQSGGPTAAINATLAGVIRGASEMRAKGAVNKLYGMRNGIEGFLIENLVDLTDRLDDEAWLSALEATPAAALGSCRKRLKDHKTDAETYERILGILKKYDIRYFFYIGGNDSMDTVLKLSDYAADHEYELRVVGVPKTIDNDLAVTDHTPGFGSAAKYVATTVKEILRDVNVYTIKAVTIVEIMGRDAGWLTAAAALPAISGGAAPDLIYLPEHPFDTDRFLNDLKAALSDHPAVLVAVSEGIRDKNGRYIGEGLIGGAVDAFGHTQLSGVGKVLEALVKEKIGCKVRSIELNLPQRCASHLASATDISESSAVGAAAVRFAVEGKTGIMATIIREDTEDYRVSYGFAEIASIANAVRTVPASYINENGNGITEEGIAYLRPLIVGEIPCEYENGLPKHIII